MKIYFENLNGLRFIAFLAIFFHHSFFTESSLVENTIIYKIIEFIKRPFYLGVPFFFCLSGFLITYLLISEIDIYKKIHVGKFYVRRILRIWVLYYIVVIFGFFVFPVLRKLILPGDYNETANFWNYVFFLSNFDQLKNGLPYGPGLGVTWSLSVEEQFYFIWPLLLSIFRPKYFSGLTLGIFVIGNISMLFFDVSYMHTLGSMTDLSMGSFLAIICHNKTPLFHFMKNISNKTIILIYTTGIIYIYSMAHLEIKFGVLTSLFMAFVIFEQCYCKNSFIKMSRFKKISYLGTLTYGLYLFHTICNFIVHNFLLVFNKALNMPLLTDLVIQPVLSFLLTIIVGYYSYKYIESPVLKLKLKFSRVDTSESQILKPR